MTLPCSQKAEQSLSHLTDSELGLSLIDRFTYQTLAFFEGIAIQSGATLQDLLNTYSYDLMQSHFSYRATTAGRQPSTVKLTDFFGSVADVLTNSDRGPQDDMYHGDTGIGRYVTGYLAQEAPWDIDASILHDQEEASSLEHAGIVATAVSQPGTMYGNGTCYEIKCYPTSFTDAYGENLDRNHACYDPDASLVFRITDTCPCVYPDNAYSNKRWCCGDMPHFDISIWGFEKLANIKWGVIGLQFRRVPCSYTPSRVAPAVPNPTPGEQPPANYNPKIIRAWPDVANTSLAQVYDGGLKSGWKDESYNVQAGNAMNGMSFGQAKCTSTQPKGAIVFKGWNGAFVNHIAVELFVYMSTNAEIEKGVVVVIGGDQGDCAAIDLHELKAISFKPRCTTCSDYWWKWEIYLSAFAGYGPTSMINNAKYFKGCGDNTVQELTYIEIRNYHNSAQNMCVDHVQLV
ncbi:hypothetical protein GPECTOR_26g522 [Gonium pectorale]|uniref:Expansin-like EG45 domain-containing protein n=1 Tax=Gonium pectorale TaxID=33097 RepID=A0A150GFL0_GONPE|nr:hypothetical protein GPECTOR_26g522 [Gonium pectorale]|eukprot:KXZ48619.1 hypothetical protein GPECTOR_26g522 [Gonium pectorale]